MQAQRYIIHYDGRGEQAHPNGDFVHYADYARLREQHVEALKVLRSVSSFLGWDPFHSCDGVVAEDLHKRVAAVIRKSADG